MDKVYDPRVDDFVTSDNLNFALPNLAREGGIVIGNGNLYSKNFLKKIAKWAESYEEEV